MSGVMPKMRLITVKMPVLYVEGIDELVRIGRYSSRSEVIRVAIRDFLKKELWIREASEI
ncbi:ribbon-helix-helix domain-containing protein [Desulfurococcus amylolyticus]|uniref:Putative transcriptional regulator, CopG/Arc/MetJ family n=1 Tax=Desulfurococcus amylolyticus DSM 16532 TaxID=768672 RepID=I3XTJ7_DESAM|nr:ribbon-helix-helix domain-containing protein [Desulfurococcus amylolyticus]AFL67271.1 putative transcriptional regulator, CopG/Arc/MetJ family [Desulfurococcus amylolyticus DSM 16532]